MSRITPRARLEAKLIAEGKLPPRDANPPAPLKGKDALFALGRLKTGERNKTEQRYEDQVLRVGIMTGAVLWYRFEGVKLRIADNTFLTVDYAVLPADGILTMIDVKGGQAVIQDDARVKMKVAAEAYPFRFQFAYPDGGGWTHEDVGR
ncbi:hypothetical protein [Sphingobium sp. YR657]|uniref:hypothetical protein n=1 Tax=Sphingobium sp. YR657 TaxID=1884366 RepID=UPI003137F667